MKSTSPFDNAYLRFLRLVSAASGQSGGRHLDANEKALFEALALRWSQGDPMSVREAIHLDHLGSPATLHKRLQRLIEKQLISTQGIERDRRTKLLLISDQGQSYIEWLGRQFDLVKTGPSR